MLKIVPTSQNGGQETTIIKNARVLLIHLLRQDFDLLIRERTELSDQFIIEIAKFESPLAERALKNARTYPFFLESQRIDILESLAQELSDPDTLTEEVEREFISIYKQILEASDDFRHQKGVAADQLGLILKNTSYMPPILARPLALSYMRKSLEYFDRNEETIDWATVHNNIGNLFSRGVSGDQAADVAIAIEEYRTAKSVITEEIAPGLLASISDNLAIALARKPEGDRVHNLALALDECTTALRIWSFTDDAVDRLKACANYLLMVSHLLHHLGAIESRGIWRSRRTKMNKLPLVRGVPLADAVRDVIDPVTLYYNQVQHDIFFRPSGIHLHVAEHLAELVPKLDAALDLRLGNSGDRWTKHAEWIGGRLQEWRGEISAPTLG